MYADEVQSLVREGFAVVRSKKSKRTKRIPESCVTLVESEEQALRQAEPERGLHAARVYGPSPSSEGVKVFHLVRWL